MSVLAEIIAATKADLDQRRVHIDVDALRGAAQARLLSRPPVDVAACLRTDDVAVIAEVKRRSPSAGDLAVIGEPAVLAGEYQSGGAAMISVLTEPHWFKGSMADMSSVRAAVYLPVLRKDFIIDEIQILEACAAGADAVLLIVAALSDDQLAHLLQFVEHCHMSALVEVHDEPQAQKAVDAGARIIGVNARNLDTLRVEPSTFEQLVNLLPSTAVKVAESGLRDAADVAAAVKAGADAVLVGQALVQTANPAALIQEMKEAARGAR
jgi:indole-3-glycerol phosphate synthase